MAENKFLFMRAIIDRFDSPYSCDLSSKISCQLQDTLKFMLGMHRPDGSNIRFSICGGISLLVHEAMSDRKIEDVDFIVHPDDFVYIKEYVRIYGFSGVSLVNSGYAELIDGNPDINQLRCMLFDSSTGDNIEFCIFRDDSGEFRESVDTKVDIRFESHYVEDGEYWISTVDNFKSISISHPAYSIAAKLMYLKNALTRNLAGGGRMHKCIGIKSPVSDMDHRLSKHMQDSFLYAMSCRDRWTGNISCDSGISLPF